MRGSTLGQKKNVSVLTRGHLFNVSLTWHYFEPKVCAVVPCDTFDLSEEGL